jgi:NTP pyrophosphatase (non-canonical NTP hydrolase)
VAPEGWNEIHERLARFRDERDWRQFHTLKDLSAAIAIEVGELQELFLWQPIEHERELLQNSREAIEDELADVFIQALNFALAADIDVAAVINQKITKNERRYPKETSRGSSRKAQPE